VQIYIIRHGQSTNNANHPDTPPVPDPPLTSLGQAQAALTAKALRAEISEVSALYVSPMRRTLQTAHPIRAALRRTPYVFPDLCEAGGLGEHPGMSCEEILREWPEVHLDERITPHGWWTPGESAVVEETFYARAERIWAFLRTRHSLDDPPVVVVTHGRIGSALVSTMLGLGPMGCSRFPFDNCAITRLDFDRYTDVAYAPPPALPDSLASRLEVGRLMFHARMAHLPPTLITR